MGNPTLDAASIVNDEEEDLALDEEGKRWLADKIEEEAIRLRKAGVKPLVLSVKNFGVVRQDDHYPPLVINRLEIDTGFDFGKRIKQLMVSDSIDFPLREGFRYCNLVLLTEVLEVPLLVPYVYPSALLKEDESATLKRSLIKNDLREWLLINSKHQRSRQSISEFHDV
ncbi:hypothetical protein DFS34DRAFT_42986 [Phlyctochytrium arcticum]|nr:hypothetical protein DFS34DRAFT_42986 [Phlyctochytrium arcticum]